MAVEINVEQNIYESFSKLGLTVPSGLSILPRNLTTAVSISELTYPESVSTIRKILRNAGVQLTPIEPEGTVVPYAEEKFVEWVGPTIFISYSLWTQNPTMVTIATNLISGYIQDFFKGMPKARRRVVLDVIRETKPSGEEFKRLHYEGDGEALKELPNILKEM